MKTCKAKKAKEKIHTLVSVDILSDKPINVTVCGSYADRGSAAAACADYVVERAELRSDIRYALCNDLNHPGLLKEASDMSGVSRRRLRTMFCGKRFPPLPEDVKSALWSCVRWSVWCDGSYDIETDMYSRLGAATFIFYVQGNELDRRKRRIP